MVRRNLERGGRWLAAAALAGAGLTAAIVTSPGGAATQATTTTTTTAATTTAATTTAATTTAATTTAPTTTAATTTAATTTGSAPADQSPPTVSGTPRAGSTLTAQPGGWSSSTAVSYAYRWSRCSNTGGSCAAISGASAQTYVPGSADVGNTLRVDVTATNATGSSTAESAPTAVIAAAATTTTATTTATGCPAVAKGKLVQVSQVAAPARLSISGFQSNPARLSGQTTSFTLRVVVGDGCGHPVQGALVYATAVPFEQFSVPAEQLTGPDGSATLTFQREARYPASRRQELLALFLRARKPGDDVLGGISTRQLVSVPVSLR